MKFGLVIAKKEKDLSGLDRFLKEGSDVEVFLFPEGYLKEENLKQTKQLVKQHKKWLVSSFSEGREGKKFETGIIINPEGEIVGKHRKTTLTKREVERGFRPGKDITPITSDFGKAGICVCFEIHFPEIAREYKLQGARIIFNPIGTGMYNEEQYKLWTAVAKARAHENRVFVLGCSHFSDAIPIAYAYDKEGVEILRARNASRLFKVDLKIEEITKEDDEFSHLKKRTPRLYKHLTISNKRPSAE